MIKLIRNDLHPHPEVRSGMMIYVAVVLVASAVVVPMLHAHPTARTVYGVSVVLSIGLVSYLFNHRWRGAFF